MRSNWQPIALVAAAVLLLAAGCSHEDSESEGPARAGGAEYVQAVEELLGPALLVARRVSAHMSGRQIAQVEELLEARSVALSELDELRELPVSSEVLDRQRDRLVRSFEPVMARMGNVIADIRAADRDGIARSGPKYFASLEDLPSAVSY